MKAHNELRVALYNATSNKMKLQVQNMRDREIESRKGEIDEDVDEDGDLMLQNSLDILIAKNDQASSTLSELNEQVGEKWSLNVEQKRTLTEVVKKFIADPLCSSYAKIADEVEAHCKNKKLVLNLASAVKTGSHRKAFKSILRETVNNHKWSFRHLQQYTCEEPKSDYFAGFDSWIQKKIELWGNNFDGQDWQEFLAETQKLDGQKSTSTIPPPPAVPLSMFDDLGDIFPSNQAMPRPTQSLPTWMPSSCISSNFTPMSSPVSTTARNALHIPGAHAASTREFQADNRLAVSLPTRSSCSSPATDFTHMSRHPSRSSPTPHHEFQYGSGHLSSQSSPTIGSFHPHHSLSLEFPLVSSHPHCHSISPQSDTSSDFTYGISGMAHSTFEGLIEQQPMSRGPHRAWL
ncbi:hypothetical protein GYMLUDRAFT_244817 [Collybiopsis luxurians FD-317 M1]|uniref:Uncharacterized protein n=1 Tax=Collybiopsis luxurians FD-317 M1 TaxID=944289 RepID=A0A0D0CVL0_9AGAR|nr:hypothetical protein GYMLUDRAFT_244817 [Collybiopsis luxurians FD-317 M1]